MADRDDGVRATMTGAPVIRPDDPLSPAALRLLQAHHVHSNAHSPPESVHALQPEELAAPGVTFWTARQGDDVIGCCAMKELDAGHGELKSMHTAESRRGQGIGGRMLDFLIAEARRRGYRRVSLETGSMDAYRPARAMYAGRGFVACPPFGAYIADPNSAFMTLDLVSGAGGDHPVGARGE